MKKNFDIPDLEQIHRQFEADRQLAGRPLNEEFLPDDDSSDKLQRVAIDSFDTFYFKDEAVGHDVMMSGDAIYAFLSACDDMNVVNIENFEVESSDEFSFSIGCDISSSYIQNEDEEWEFDEAHIYRRVSDGTYRGQYKKETFYEIPKEFRDIPNADTDRMFMLFTDSGAQIDILVEFNETGGWRDRDDTGWAEYPDLSIKRIEKIELVCQDNKLDIKDILPKDCIEFIKDFINSVMDEYQTNLVGE